MAWGKIDGASSELLQFHLFLTNELASQAWTKSQIWDSRLSTHSWKPVIGPELAIDAALAADKVTFTLVSRDATWADAVDDALRREGTKYTRNANPTNRFTIPPVPRNGSIEDLAKEAAAAIRKLRQALEAAIREKQEWQDPETGLTIPYVVKPERKNNPSVIFLFTSIRAKSHWLDFGGPAGASLQTNRARIIFLLDEFEENYTYQLASNKDTTIHEATVRFITAYVKTEGIDWSYVTLAGMSKGGTGALATAAHLPACELVIVAPQLSLGEYLAEGRPGILETIVGATGAAAADETDKILWDILEAPNAGAGISKLTILTSEHDPHCTDRIPRLVETLNLAGKTHVYTDTSDDTPSHVDTVHFHASGLVSILGAISTTAAATHATY